MQILSGRKYQLLAIRLFHPLVEKVSYYEITTFILGTDFKSLIAQTEGSQLYHITGLRKHPAVDLNYLFFTHSKQKYIIKCIITLSELP